MHIQQQPPSDFEALAAQLRCRISKRADDEFKLAVVRALQALETFSHRRAMESLALLNACVTCEEDHDDAAAKLLMFVSGAITNPALVRALLETIQGVTSQFKV